MMWASLRCHECNLLSLNAIFAVRLTPSIPKRPVLEMIRPRQSVASQPHCSIIPKTHSPPGHLGLSSPIYTLIL